MVAIEGKAALTAHREQNNKTKAQNITTIGIQ